MRLRSSALLLTLCVTCFCSTLRITVDFDRSADFTKYRTFAFAPGTPARNELTQARIEQGVARELTALGMIAVDRGHPDLLVSTHAVVEHERRVETIVWGYGCRWGGGVVETTVTNVPVGTLIVDLVDRAQNCLIWQGRATDTIAADSRAREEQLNAALRGMFESFPGLVNVYRSRQELPQ